MSDTPALNYEPRGDRVIVRRLPRPLPKEGELIEPDSQKKLFNEGVVMAVSPLMKGQMNVGDHVCFLEYAGTEVEVDGTAYLSMRDQEIHGRRLA